MASTSKSKLLWVRRIAVRLFILQACVLAALSQTAQAQGTSTFVYEGRLTTSGAPVAGPVTLRIRFFHSNNANSTPVLVVTKGLENVPLSEGIFQVRLELAQSDYNEVFSGVGQPVWLDVTDMAHPSSPYPVQEVSTVPYAARVPVDNQTVSFNSSGELSVGPSSAPSTGQFLTKDSNGNLIWSTPAGNGAVLQGQTVSTTSPGSGQVLEYNGSQWVPMPLSANGNIVSSVTASSPLAVTGSNGTPTITVAQATSISSGYLSASDWVNFSGKVSKAGDSMSGTLDMGSSLIRHLANPTVGSDAANKSYVDSAISLQGLSASGSTPLTGNWAVGGKDITAIGNVGISAAKTLSLGTFDNTSEPVLIAGLGASDKGKTWFNLATNQLKYWDGSVAQAVGASGSGLTNLNGLSSTTQLLAVSAGGSALTWNSVGSTHTLDLPLASIGGVAAGLLSNSDYASFTGKVAAVGAGVGLAASTASGSVTIGLANTGTAGSYTKVTTNAQGQVTSGASLSAADIPALSVSALTSGTLPVSLGGTGLAAAPGAGQLLIGNGASGYALGSLGEGVTQGVTIAAGAGTITLDTAQDIRPTASPVFSGLEISGVTSSLLKTNSSGVVVSAAASDVTTTLGYTPVNKAGDTLSGGLSLGGPITARGINAPALSAAGSGVIYFDTGSSQFKVSQNGLAYAPLISGGSVSNVSTGTGLVGGPITTSGTLSLATVGTAGSYVKVITDSFGRVVGTTSLLNSDLPSISATAITAGTLAVANGGTGVSTLTNNGLLVGAGSMAVSTLSTSTQYNVLTATTGGVPSYGQVALNQSAAVTGTLAPANGGTGLATLGTANQLLGVVGAGGALEYKTVAGTAGEISVSNVTGTLTLATPQAIATTSSPSFVTVNLSGSLGLGSNAPNSILDISGAFTERGLSAAPPTSSSGQGVLYFDSALHHFYVSENGGSYQQLSSGVAATTVTAGAGLLGGSFSTNGTISLPPIGTVGTYAKVITDTYGRVTGAASLAAADIPALPASAITSGTLALSTVPSLPASAVTSGSFSVAQIPSLPASIIASGTLALATVPSLPASTISSGSFSVAQIPALPASIIASGTFSPAQLPSLAGTYVAVTGSTMNGALNLPLNGLSAGTNQFVLANGNVGIGTSSPGAKLQVGGTAGTDGIMFPDGTLQTSAAVSSGTSQWNSNGAKLYYNTGNVGIGTNNPNALLTVGPALTGSALGTAFISNAGTLGTAAGSTLTLANVGFTSTNATSLGLRAYRTSTGSGFTTARIDLGVMVDGVVWPDGVGNPSTPLISMSPASLTMPTGANIYSGTSFDPAGGIYHANTVTQNANSSLPVASLAVGVNGTSGANLNTYAGYFNNSSTVSGTGFNYGVYAIGTNNYVSGNMGIGTTAPAGKLDVAGTICFSGTNCISSWPGGGTTAVTSVSAGIGLVGGPITSTGSLSLATVGTAGSYSKVMTDAYGRVVGSTSLVPFDIPALSASAITSGTFNLGTIPSIPASSITSGTFNIAELPAHSAALITSGTLSSTLLPNLAGTYVAVTGSTMTGALNLPANGLSAGSNQLVLAGGNVGIGTTAPGQILNLSSNSSWTNTTTPWGSSANMYTYNSNQTNSTMAGYMMGTIDSNSTLQTVGGIFSIINSHTAGSWAADMALWTATNATPAERMRITAAGNVGIGTSTPNAALSVVTPNAASGISLGNSANGHENLLISTSGDAGSNSYGYIAAANSGVTYNALALQPSGGNVGIGTSVPSQLFEIRGALGSPATTGTTQTGIFRLGGNDGGALDFGTIAGGYGSWLQSGDRTGLGSHYGLLLNPNGGSVSIGTTAINSGALLVMGGNVGIGTTSPGSMLDINGAATWRALAAPSVSAAGQGVIYFDSSVNKFKVSENAGSFGYLVASDSSANFGSYSVTAATAVIGTGDGSSSIGGGTVRGPNAVGTNVSGGNLLIAAGDGTGLGSSGSIQFQTAAAGVSGTAPGSLTTALAIVPNGNVGVGTTTPAGLFDVNGKLTVLSSGNVGIGTTTPTAILETALNGSGTRTTNLRLRNLGTGANTAPSIGFNDSGTLNVDPAYISSPYNYGNGAELAFATGGGIGYTASGTEAMRIAYNGNVGIGTTAPSDVLNVVSSNWGGINVTSSSTDAGILYRNNTAGGRSYALLSSGTGSAAGVGNFTLYDATASATRLSVTSSGNVGIGTTMPATKLEIDGSLAPASVGVEDELSLHRGNNGGISWDNWAAFSLGTYSKGDQFQHSRLDIKLSDAASTSAESAVNSIMTLQANGNVGIGTTAPAGQLHILNSGGATTFTLGNNATGKSSGYMGTTNDTAGNFYIQSVLSAGSTYGTLLLNPNAGNIGIGTNGATQALDIFASGGTPATTGTTQAGILRVHGANGNTLDMGTYPSSPYGSWLQTTNVGNLGVYYPITLQPNGGNVGIGTATPNYTLHVVGTAGLSTGTSWTNASDIRLKDIEGDYEYGLEEIRNLHTVRFKYKAGNALNLPTADEHTGFIAQEVQKVIPDAVHTREDGYLELNVDPIHWATVNAVQELARENDQLRADAAQLKADKDAQIGQLKADAALRNAEKDAQIGQLKADAAQLKAFICSQFANAAICAK